MTHRVLNIYKELDMTGPDNTPIFRIGGTWELSLKGVWVGKVWVLRRFESTDDWGVAQVYESNVEDSAFFQGGSVADYMVAVGEAGTGTCIVRCVK